MYRFRLEKHNGPSTRYTCPNCGKRREFTRYVDTETGEYINENVGICNRKAKCNYHYPPREYFSDNPGNDSAQRTPVRGRRVETRSKIQVGFDSIDPSILERTLGFDNAFLHFLTVTFGSELTVSAANDYRVGTWGDGRTVFWQIDERFRIRTGKLMTYSPATGKRCKQRPPSWVHAELKKHGGPVSEEFRLRQCYYGQHLIGRDRMRPLAIVESEKTSVIASMVFPKCVWLATGGCSNLRLLDIVRLVGGRPIRLFPDSTQFDRWSAAAKKVNLSGGRVIVSELLENSLAEDLKGKDIDLADVILSLNPEI